MTAMRDEICQTADVLCHQAENPAIATFGARLCKNPPKGLVTIARGTSDHAAEYLAYLLMRYRGIPAASLPMSLNTLYHTSWHLQDCLALTISQSGGSPDLVESVAQVRKGGAEAVAIVNTVPSPLAEVSDIVLDIQAGVERSVAATKSFVASVALGIRAFNEWFGDRQLTTTLKALPEKITVAQDLDWSPAIEMLEPLDRLYVIGRGTGLAIAKEAALKCKETCIIHAEAFSGAEVKHGPMALINPRQVVLILAPPDETQPGLRRLAETFRGIGANVLLAADDAVKERDLPLVDGGHSALQGLTTIQTFYAAAERLSVVRGVDTDNPPNLRKVTETR